MSLSFLDDEFGRLGCRIYKGVPHVTRGVVKNLAKIFSSIKIAG
jgi:hypothetical protein